VFLQNILNFLSKSCVRKMAERGKVASVSGPVITDRPVNKSSNLKPQKSSKVTIICPICVEEVIDGGKSKKGHDSIFCDGACQEWIHCHWAGLSQSAFKAVSSSTSPFHCPRCLFVHQSKEISDLKSSLAQLSNEVLTLKAQFASLVGRDRSSVVPHSPSSSADQEQLTTTQSRVYHRDNSKVPIQDDSANRKYNVVVFGVPEQSVGTPRSERSRYKFSEISIISSIY
jgi:hypothetical protein